MNQTINKTKKPIGQFDKNPVESLLNIGSGVLKSFANDVVKQSGSDFLSQMVSVGATEKTQSPEKVSGELIPGQEVSFANLKNVKTEKKAEKSREKPLIEAGIDYTREILHGGRIIEQKENQRNYSLIQQILTELKQLTAMSKQLQVEFKEVTIEQRITKPGKYHVSLFQWILAVIKQAKMKVEDSKAWLATAKNKHAKKRNYWELADEKVGGTSFSLSGERVVATQTG